MSKRRLLEWGKTLLILLLSVTAVGLLAMTPLVQDSGLADLFSPRRGNGGGSGRDSQGSCLQCAGGETGRGSTGHRSGTGSAGG